MKRTRRQVVLSGIALGASAIAGCGGGVGTAPTESDIPTDSHTATDTPADSTPSGTPTGTDSETTTPTFTATPGTETRPTVVEASLESGQGSCGSEPRARITQTDDGIHVDGVIVASTPCHRATLVGYSDEGGVAEFRIEVKDEDVEVCEQCIGTIPFSLDATFRGSFEEVTLVLRGQTPRTFHKELS